MGIVKVDHEALNTIGQSFLSRVEDLNEVQQYVNSQVHGQLADVWVGDGYNGYVARVESVQPAFEAIKRVLEDLGKAAIEVNQKYAEFDASARVALEK